MAEQDDDLGGGMTSSTLLPASINISGLSDSAAATDQFGYDPYVKAMAAFLLDEDTKAPLTISVEGGWGSGKSSFLSLLRGQLPKILCKWNTEDANAWKDHGRKQRKEKPKPKKCYTVWFNAWQCDRDDALWASFALAFMEQIADQISFRRRIWGNIALLRSRMDLSKVWSLLLKFLWFLCVVGVAWWHRHAIIATGSKIPHVDAGLAILLPPSLLAAIEQARRTLGNPIPRDLKNYIKNPNYDGKVSFIEHFKTDFANILASYCGSDRVFVFIDDLDRCEVPHAADLMQAINLLIAADPQTRSVKRSTKERAKSANLFFVLALDREMVAAGIAAKHKEILPYLVPPAPESGLADSASGRAGLEFGYRFIEKFIQLPFRLPETTKQSNMIYVAGLTVTSTVSQTTPTDTSTRPPDFGRGEDPETFNETVCDVARALHFNPRRVKQLLNALRLQLLALVYTGKLSVASTAGQGVGPNDRLALRDVGFLTGLFLKFPMLAGDVARDRKLLAELRTATEESTAALLTSVEEQDQQAKPAPSPAFTYWSNQKELMVLLPNLPESCCTPTALDHILDVAAAPMDGQSYLARTAGPPRPISVTGTMAEATTGRGHAFIAKPSASVNANSESTHTPPASGAVNFNAGGSFSTGNNSPAA